jgi:hypothetical protein
MLARRAEEICRQQATTSSAREGGSRTTGIPRRWRACCTPRDSSRPNSGVTLPGAGYRGAGVDAARAAPRDAGSVEIRLGLRAAVIAAGCWEAEEDAAGRAVAVPDIRPAAWYRCTR